VLLQTVIIATLTLLAMILYIPPLASFFKITSLNGMQIGWSVATAFVSVIWFEIYKWTKRKRDAKQSGLNLYTNNSSRFISTFNIFK
jgi:Ca2+-transporting ATPase